MRTVRPGETGDEVRALQSALNTHLALDPPLTVDGHYGPLTLEAVYAFQASSVGPDDRPLSVDGIVGPVTWWALLNDDQSDSVRAFGEHPYMTAPRSQLGAEVVRQAAKEMHAGAREVGGNNQGEFVEKYLLGETGAWCAGFVSYCVFEACAELIRDMPFDYTGSARSIRNQLDRKGLAFEGEEPMAGDLAFWWRVSPSSWQGHVEVVTGARDGMFWTIGGNRGSYPAPVRAFSYVTEREKRMLGFARLE